MPAPPPAKKQLELVLTNQRQVCGSEQFRRMVLSRCTTSRVTNTGDSLIVRMEKARERRRGSAFSHCSLQSVFGKSEVRKACNLHAAEGPRSVHSAHNPGSIRVPGRRLPKSPEFYPIKPNSGLPGARNWVVVQFDSLCFV